ncbi:glucokinase [Antarcticibacterium arcticum]|uniref:Glucokinase n=1 Tax=Antarcticibacterium arcticum TaxID=2585771 RepID=A0A5B8YL06_9FLAO|nr:glucokinase [Antarcticibacterium arcticum]QED37006.1 glucokinase [Antarcticibacterium arcticum]
MKKSITLIPDGREKNNVRFTSGNLRNTTGIILAGDIGGTKINLSLYQLEKGILKPLLEKTYFTKKHSSFESLLKTFREENTELPAIDCICLGVAGPVIEGRVTGTNFPWEISETELQKATGIAHIFLINDMEANAYGLATLEENELTEIKSGPGMAGNKALISPGTGLGEAGMFWDGKLYQPFATEGGHCDFSPRNELDIALFKYLQNLYGHVSWERIISGPGIHTLYQFLLNFKQEKEPAGLLQDFEQIPPAAVISDCAKTGRFPICREAMELFFRYLAIETSQIALKFKATGGIYIGGGILPKVLELLDRKKFTEEFLQVDKMNSLLEEIPIYLITNKNSPMHGAAYYAVLRLFESKE